MVENATQLRFTKRELMFGELRNRRGEGLRPLSHARPSVVRPFECHSSLLRRAARHRRAPPLAG